MKKFIALILVLIFTTLCAAACDSQPTEAVPANEVVETQTEA